MTNMQIFFDYLDNPDNLTSEITDDFTMVGKLLPDKRSMAGQDNNLFLYRGANHYYSS